MKQGWELKKLEELSKKKNAVVSGPFGSNLKVSDYKKDGVPILRLQNIGKGYFIDKDIKYISEEKAEELKYHSFISGDIALAKLGIPIGKTCIIPNQFKSGIITADIVRIRPDRNIVDYNFLEYFLNTDLSVAQLTSNISGATRPRVNLSEVREIEVPIPSLAEQKRIVAILDEAFVAIAKSKENAEKNLQNAKELFENYLQSVFENGKLKIENGEWEEKKLGDVCEFKSGTTIHPSLERKEGDVLYTKVADMNLDENLIEIKTSSRFVNFNEIKKSQIIPEGSIIFPKRGGAIATNKKRKIVKPTIVDLNTMAMIPSKIIDKDFLFYWFQQIDLNEISNGTSIPQINNYSFDEVYISYPISLTIQHKIVQKLDVLSTETKKLESIYKQKLNDLEELKKSILHKAFNGDLNTTKELEAV